MKAYEVIASPESWIEGEAVRQLAATAALPGMVRAVGLPDLHPGRGQPIGAAFVAADRIYPHLVGSDIGCGIALFETQLSARKPKRDAWAKRLASLGELDPAIAAAITTEVGGPPELAASLGTIGHGNHFAELSRFDQIFDRAALDQLGCDPDRMQLLVHSGSRGLGAAILRAHTDAHGAEGLVAGSAEMDKYLVDHDRAVRWAEHNRRCIGQRLADRLGTPFERRVDLCHNSVTRCGEGWLHRKGAAPHDRGPVLIAGSRGTPSYLVSPTGDGARAAWSLAHGAGRKWTRSEARARMKDRYAPAALLQTELGGRVICDDRDLLYEEAPQAYKAIDQVIADLVAAGLCRPLATLRPVVTYKVGGGGEDD